MLQFLADNPEVAKEMEDKIKMQIGGTSPVVEEETSETKVEKTK